MELINKTDPFTFFAFVISIVASKSEDVEKCVIRLRKTPGIACQYFLL